jgi:hypothetical protein
MNGVMSQISIHLQILLITVLRYNSESKIMLLMCESLIYRHIIMILMYHQVDHFLSIIMLLLPIVLA